MGRRIRYAEKGGGLLNSILIQTDPWKGEDCVRVDCHACESVSIKLASRGDVPC